VEGVDDHGHGPSVPRGVFLLWNIERTALAGVESGLQAGDGRLPPPEEEKEIRELSAEQRTGPEIAPNPAG